MRKILLFLIFIVLLLQNNSFAAFNSTIDSLFMQLEKVQQDTNRVDILNNIAWIIRRSYPDSAQAFAKEAHTLSQKLDYNLGEAKYFRIMGSIHKDQGDFIAARESYFRSLELYQKISQSKNNYYADVGNTGVANNYNGIGLVEWRLGNYSVALDYFYQSIELFKNLDYNLGIANCYNNIGLIHWNQKNYERAVSYFKQSKDIYTKLNHKNGIAHSLNNIGIIYKNQGDLEKALEFYKQSLVIYTELDDRRGMCSANNNIGILYRELGQFNLAKEYNKKALDIYTERGDKNGIAIAHGSLANLYNNIAWSKTIPAERNKNFKKAIHHASIALTIAKEIGSLNRIKEANNYLSIAHEGIGAYKKALEYHKASITAKDSLFTIEKNEQIENAEARFQAAQKQQEIEKQKLELKRQKTIQNFLFIFSVLIIIVAISIFSRFLLKKKTNKLLEEKNEELQSIILELNKLSIVASETDNAVIITDANGNFEWINEGFTRMYGYNFKELIEHRGKNIVPASENPKIQELLEKWVKNKKPIHYEAQSKKKNGEEIWVQTTINPVLNHNNEIEKIVVIDSDITDLKNAEKEILQWKEDITDSIAYAKRIQEAMLSDQMAIKNYFADCFLLYKPKDIVSGDFYWYSQVDNKKIIVAADCTGHGVPGAFMSLIGISFLNKIVNEQKVTQPDQILTKLHENIVESLHKNTQQETNDGMDISIVTVDEQKKEVAFSGAMNPMYLIKNNNLHEYKANIATIGVPLTRKEFEKQIFKYEQGDLMYLFSDGFADQFGGEKCAKLKYHQFKNKLLENHQLSLQEQQNLLWNFFLEWKGKYEQIDDILVIGIKL